MYPKREVTQVAGTALTGRDWSADFAQLAYVGGHRWGTRTHYSGDVTVGPGATVVTFSVSGIGYQRGLLYHYSAGIPPYNARLRYSVDGGGIPPSTWHGYFDIDEGNYHGLGSVGWHLNRLRVSVWDTATHTYTMFNVFHPEILYFRTSLAGQLENTHATDSSTQKHLICYNLFVSSKRILCKLPRYVSATELRKKAGSKRLKHPIIVERIGYFEDETEHPYRDFLTDLPNEWDTEITLKDGTKVKSCSPKKAKVVLSLFVPEDWSAKKALGKIKPEKVLT